MPWTPIRGIANSPASELDPRAVEVAEADDGVDVHLLRHERGVERRRLVRQGEDAHARSLEGGGGAPAGPPPTTQAQTGVAAVDRASSGCFSSSSGVAGTSSRQLIGSLSCTTWRTM